MIFILIGAEKALTCSKVAHGSGKERVAWRLGRLGRQLPQINVTQLLRIRSLMMIYDCGRGVLLECNAVVILPLDHYDSA